MSEVISLVKEATKSDRLECEIRLLQHEDGRWMWSTSFMAQLEGCGYAPMPKWGKFADSLEEAKRKAGEEMLRITKKLGHEARNVPDWVAEITGEKLEQAELF